MGRIDSTVPHFASLRVLRACNPLLSILKKLPAHADKNTIGLRKPSSRRPWGGNSMHSAVTFTGWDTVVIMTPFFALLAFWMFGLDARVARPKTASPRRRFCKPDDQLGEPECSDPDGKPWRRRRLSLLPPNRAGVVEIPLPAAPAQPQVATTEPQANHKKWNGLVLHKANARHAWPENTDSVQKSIDPEPESL
ncbi:MAG TPA: hypothetical protein VGJ21_08330 [Terracidiphilus sp.]|jgi:hypothetical protein